MVQDGKVQYFLGANSAEGFVSLYDELIDESQASAVYILKGGPGCGKSTLMKKVGEEMEKGGYYVEYILCSGDPDSLDGILIPEKAVAIMDGTAPHGRYRKTHKNIIDDRNGFKISSEHVCFGHEILDFLLQHQYEGGMPEKGRAGVAD